MSTDIHSVNCQQCLVV